MNLCACGCGTPVSRRFVLGHQLRKKSTDVGSIPAPGIIADVAQTVEQLPRNQQVGSSILPIGLQPPPPHPASYDHGRFRVAEEPPGTDLYQAWELDYCLECRLPVFTHNAKVAAKHESLCESCAYLLLTELTETRVAKENRIQRGNYDPFNS